VFLLDVVNVCVTVFCSHAFGRPGGDLLSRVLRRSTIGAEGFHGRVRDGIGCWAPRYGHQVVQGHVCLPLRSPAKPGEGGVCEVSKVSYREPRWLWGFYRCARASTGKSDQAERAISTSRLNALPRFHPWPIDVMVYHGSSGRPGFEVSFPLRCIQRLSRPHIATRRCRWRDNRYTRGASIPVLSY
jgi:hypothetical protein